MTVKIALDFDGVLSDTMDRWVNIYNSAVPKHKHHATYSDIDQWNFYKKFDISQDECFDIFSLAWKNWRSLKPMERHINLKTETLYELGYVDIVTSVLPEYIYAVKNWLEMYGVKYNNIVHSNEKHKLDYDIYIDDSERNILNAGKAGKIAVLYNQPWNQDVFLFDRYISRDIKAIRVYNLDQAIERISHYIRFVKDSEF